jgi:hypothetical protein
MIQDKIERFSIDKSRINDGGSHDLAGQPIPIESRFVPDGQRTRLIVHGSGHAAGFGLGYHGPDTKSRRYQGGPLEKGPYAYAFGHASVIDDRGGTRAELERSKAAGSLVECCLGDELEIDGNVFKIAAAPNNNIRLDLVEETEKPHHLSRMQAEALDGLYRALSIANGTGLLDVLKSLENPSHIDNFCEIVSYLMGNHKTH